MKTTRSPARGEGVTSFPAHRTLPLAAAGKRPSALRPERWRSLTVDASQSPFSLFGGAVTVPEEVLLFLPMVKE